MTVLISWDEAALLLVQALRAQCRIGNGKVEVTFHSKKGLGLECVKFRECADDTALGVTVDT